MAETVQRVHDGSSFADVPTACVASIGDRVDISCVDEDCSFSDGVLLRGQFLADDGHGSIVVSCGGLLARVAVRTIPTEEEEVFVLVKRSERRRSPRSKG